MNRNILEEKEYYPTPKEVCEKFIFPYITEDTELPSWYRNKYGSRVSTTEKVKVLKDTYSILEPSAGTGEILDYLQEFVITDFKADVVELNFNFQAILREKNYTVVADDFLKFSSRKYYNLILMNPPFQLGDSHLLKAWEVLSEGQVICILNAETLHNPYTANRKLLRSIIETHGSVEFIGKAFSSAVRKTDAEIAVVVLYKDATLKDNFDFTFASRTEQDLETDLPITEETLLKKPNFIKDKVEQFDNALSAFGEYLLAYNKAEFYLQGLTYSTLLELVKKVNVSFSDKGKKSYQNFSDVLTKAAWDKIFYSTKFKSLLTAGVQREFEKMCEMTGVKDFNEQNILSFIDTLFFSRVEIQKQALLEVFENLTKYDELNKVHTEGWKTNDAWKINKRVIIPYAVENTFSKGFSIRKRQEINDIDRVMCYLSGVKFENVKKIESCLDYHSPIKSGESEFFHVRWFKKMTMHLEFKDLKLLEKFNREAALGKGWIPDDYKERGNNVR